MESTGKRFRHWVTVFEHEHDDIFDGQLGEQDDEQPRILLDYSIALAKGGSFRKELTRRVQERPVETIVEKHSKVYGGQSAPYGAPVVRTTIQ